MAVALPPPATPDLRRTVTDTHEKGAASILLNRSVSMPQEVFFVRCIITCFGEISADGKRRKLPMQGLCLAATDHAVGPFAVMCHRVIEVDAAKSLCENPAAADREFLHFLQKCHGRWCLARCLAHGNCEALDCYWVFPWFSVSFHVTAASHNSCHGEPIECPGIFGTALKSAATGEVAVTSREVPFRHLASPQLDRYQSAALQSYFRRRLESPQGLSQSELRRLQFLCNRCKFASQLVGHLRLQSDRPAVVHIPLSSTEGWQSA